MSSQHTSPTILASFPLVLRHILNYEVRSLQFFGLVLDSEEIFAADVLVCKSCAYESFDCSEFRIRRGKFYLRCSKTPS